jgi:NADH dehydrogenase/NADH:ubiquinone oxidoreductase subunit G
VLQLSIDSQQLTARQGQTVLEMEREASVEIPALCYHPL